MAPQIRANVAEFIRGMKKAREIVEESGEDG